MLNVFCYYVRVGLKSEAHWLRWDLERFLKQEAFSFLSGKSKWKERNKVTEARISWVKLKERQSRLICIET